jgi:hypothetical protein
MSVVVDLVSRASELFVPHPGFADLRGEGGEGTPLRRRIVAVSEGRHNGILFRAEEIRAMVERAGERETKYVAPIILDHSSRFLDKVGGAYRLEAGEHPDDGRPAAIADVEFWNTTSMLREVAERVRLDPENTFFSVRVQGELREDPADGEYLTDMRLIHIAVVNEPADPNARLISELSAVAPHETPKADEGRAWDADAAVARLRRWASRDGSGDRGTIDWARYRRGFAWYDAENPEAFGAYKLPHHDVVDGRLVVVWRGVAAAMAALLGARGGVGIPERDREAVYAHLRRHYRQFEREAPELSESDLPLNTPGPARGAKDLEEEDKMEEKDLEALRKEHEEELARLKAKHEAEVAELKKAHEARLKELRDLEAKRIEIISLDPNADRELLLSLNGEQLERYKADLERRLTERELSEKGQAGGGKGEDPYELAERYFGKVEG